MTKAGRWGGETTSERLTNTAALSLIRICFIRVILKTCPSDNFYSFKHSPKQKFWGYKVYSTKQKKKKKRVKQRKQQNRKPCAPIIPNLKVSLLFNSKSKGVALKEMKQLEH